MANRALYLRLLRDLGIGLAIAALYCLGVRVGTMLGSHDGMFWPIWLPSGLALGFMLLFGYEIWPAILAGAFIGYLTARLGTSVPLPLCLASAACVATGATLQTAAGTWVARRFANGLRALETPGTILKLGALSGALCGVIAPTFGLLALFIQRGPAPDQWELYWLNRWASGTISVLAITPLVLAWTQTSPRTWTLQNRLELIGLLLLTLVFSLVIFGFFGATPRPIETLDFLIFPLLLWAALRFGQRGSTGTVVVAAAVITTAAVAGRDSSLLKEGPIEVFMLQAEIGVLSLVGCIVAADALRRRHVTDALQRSERRYRKFSELGDELNSAQSPRAAAKIISDAAQALLGWDACMLGLLEKDGNIQIVYCLDISGNKLDEEPPHVEEPGPITRKVLKDGAQLLLRKPGEGFPDGAVPFGSHRPSASLLSVQIRKDERCIGVLTIQSYSLNAYGSEHVALLQALADHGAGALERIRTEEENQRLNRELRHHLEELQTLFAVAPVGIAVAEDPDCQVVMMNEACTAILGLERGKLPWNITFNPLQHVKMLRDGQEVPPEEHPMRRAAREGKVIRADELALQAASHHLLFCYVYASPLYRDDGRVRGSIGVFVDLSERKKSEEEILRLNAELERRVQDRTIQLEAMNKELEAFSYSVSHDLRAPLRSIRGFSEVLLERYREQLDARGQDFLKKVCDSCVQMDKLIEDLLKLSRVGRSEMQRQQVDLSSLVESVLAELKKAEPNRKIEATIQPGLKAEGDERLLRVALDNLLRNAWKFTSKKEVARIEFGLDQAPEGAFYVKDNGAGFEMAYAKKLFGVFQRLHTASEFPGTGVGLATVQRIVARHGGRVWAFGQVDQGATFYFTLPRVQQQ